MKRPLLFGLWILLFVVLALRVTALCGDGALDTSEQCDDGNTVNGDGCSASCVLTDDGSGTCNCGFFPSCNYGYTDFNLCAIGGGCGCIQAWTCGNNIIESGELCDDGNTANGDACSSTCREIQAYCGDGVLDSNQGESCDDNNLVSNDGCSSTCHEEYCGDGIVQTSEECDPEDSDLVGLCNTPEFGPNHQCEVPIVGNYFCDIGETYITAPMDCPLRIPGWDAKGNTGWTLSEDRKLQATEYNTWIQTDDMDIKEGAEYALSFEITNPTTCKVVVDFDTNSCEDENSERITSCFALDASIRTVLINNNPQSFTYNLHFTNPSGETNTVQGYFKKVHLRIGVIPVDQDGSCTVTDDLRVSIDNVHFKQTKAATVDQITYTPGEIPTEGVYGTGCCPAGWCWDGLRCVDAMNWMSNSSYPPVWNALDIANNYVSKHVLLDDRAGVRGYRCVIDTSDPSIGGNAKWIPANIKYDWHGNESGYCNDNKDCFVGRGFKNNDLNGSSCIADGRSIDDTAAVIDGGNRYCFNGDWTTKTNIIAATLTDISINPDDGTIRPHSLYCSDKLAVFNTLDYATDVATACSLVQKDHSPETVIAGFALNTIDDYGAFIVDVSTVYSQLFSDTPDVAYGIDDCTTTNAEWKNCFDSNNLQIYYNIDLGIFLMARDTLDTPAIAPVWYQRLGAFFGFRTVPPAYSPLNQTLRNYENVYIDTAGVRGLQENKYDEVAQKVLTFAHVNYTTNAQNTQRNPVETDALAKMDGVLELNYTNTSTAQQTSQQILIKQEPAAGLQLWHYLTGMLRTG